MAAGLSGATKTLHPPTTTPNPPNPTSRTHHRRRRPEGEQRPPQVADGRAPGLPTRRRLSAVPGAPGRRRGEPAVRQGVGLWAQLVHGLVRHARVRVPRRDDDPHVRGWIVGWGWGPRVCRVWGAAQRQAAPAARSFLRFGLPDASAHERGLGSPAITHRSPELLLEGKASKASDVYAFGEGSGL